MVFLLSTYLPMSVIPHSAPLFLMNLFSSLGIMYKLLTLPLFQRKASNCTDTSSYHWNNGQICWGPERWHQNGNIQEIYLVSKYTLSFSNLLVVASKRKFWKTTLLSLWKCPLPEGIKAYDDISIASPLMSHGPSNPNHTLDLNKSTDPFNPIQWLDQKWFKIKNQVREFMF